MNIIDEIVKFFDPTAALQREYARDLLSKRHFEGASSKDRMSGWTSPSSGVNSSLNDGSWQRLVNRTRDLSRNDVYANKAKRAIISNVIGTGIVGEIKNKNAKKQAEKIQDIWDRWADSTKCDANGKLNLYGIQRLAMSTVFESGEVLIRRRRRRSDSGLEVPIQLQILEPDHLDRSKDTLYAASTGKNYIQGGIEFNSLGVAVAYHLYPNHPGEATVNLSTSSVRVPADDIIHLYRYDRPNQLRGVPWLAPAVIKMRDFKDYEDAQLVRQKIAACFMAFVYDANPQVNKLSKSNDTLIDKVTPALVETLPPGRDVKFADPPGVQNYGEYATNILRGIAAGSGVPYEVLTGDLSQVNFSSARMGWIEFHREISIWREDLFTGNMLPRVWDWFSEIAGILGGKPEKMNMIWTPPRRQMIDPEREVKAMKEEIRGGLNSLSGALLEMGRDPEEVYNQVKEDNERFDTDGLVFDTDPRKTTTAGMMQQEIDNKAE